jgi:hypothetical protein
MWALPAEIENNLQFSGHETFPLRQLWLRKAYDEVGRFTSSAPRTVFADEGSIARFGVGRNMVGAIRHWALACDIISEADGGYRVTELGRFLFGPDGLDPDTEEPATVWLVHWSVAGRGRRATTWYWVFNHVVGQTFDRAGLFNSLKELIKDRQLRVTDGTLKRDVDVCLRSYVPKITADSHEDLAEPILAELGLLHEGGSGSFEFRRGPKHTLPNGVFGFALVEFWDRHAPDIATLAFDQIAHGYGSPGRVFKLDENSVADRLIALTDKSRGALQWSDTAGVRQVIRAPARIDKFALLRRAYG